MCEIRGYDKWKLSNNLDEEARRKTDTYTNEVEIRVETLGHCPCCEEIIEENTLFVVEMEEDEEVFYHFSCYNYKVGKVR